METQGKDSKFHKNEGGLALDNSKVSPAGAQSELSPADAKNASAARSELAAPQGEAQSPHVAEVTAAIKRLWMMLQIASNYDPTQIDHGRSSARIALIGVMEFLAVLFPQLDTLPPALQDLLQGLVDLDRGIVPPLLRQAELRGRPPTSFSDELLRALAAAAMTYLRKPGGMSRDSAADIVAKRINGMGHGPEKIDAAQVKKWRDNVKAEWPRESLAAQRYHHALELVAGMEPERAIKFILGSLSALHPANFPKKGAF